MDTYGTDSEGDDRLWESTGLGTTDLLNIELPEEEKEYAKSYYQVLTAIEQGSVYMKSEFNASELEDSEAEYALVIDGNPTTNSLTEIPGDESDGILKLYEVDGSGDATPKNLLAPVQERLNTVLTANDDALKVPTVQSLSDAQNKNLNFGEIVAVEDENQVYWEDGS